MTEEKNLKDRVSVDERRSKVCGWVVVAGLVIEVCLAVAFQEHKDWIENWGPAIADILVALGVYGEIHFSGKVSAADEELRREADEKVSEANEHAAEATERAAALEREAAHARVEQEKLRKSNLQLYAAIAPRQVVLVGGSTVLKKLQAAPGTIALIQSVPEFESQILLSNIAWLLEQCGWKIHLLSFEDTKTPPHSIPNGVSIYTREFGETEPFPEGSVEKKTREIGEALVEYLNIFPVEATLEPIRRIRGKPHWRLGSRISNDFEPPRDAIVIVVGMKPVPWEMSLELTRQFGERAKEAEAKAELDENARAVAKAAARPREDGR
jgi:hypothetical protein